MFKLKKIEGFLLFLTILFLPTQLGRHFWPQFSFVYSLPIDYLSPTLYFWDLLVVSLLTVWVLRRPKINWLAFNLLLVFLLTQTVSLVGTANLGAGLVRLMQYILAGGFGVYIASVGWETLSRKLYWPLVLSVLFESFLAIGQFVKSATLGFWILGERTFSLSTPGIAKFDFHGMQFLRPYATFPHPNVLAAFMVIGILLIHFFYRKDSLTKMAIFIAASATTILSFSRVSILALLVSLILLRKRWILFAILIFLLGSPFLYTRYSSLFNFDNLAFFRREQLLGISLDLFKSSPVFGVGLNNFIPKASDQILVGPSRFLQPVHNIILLSLSETGIVGIVGIAVLLGYPIWRLSKLPTTNYQLPTLLLAWVAIIFMGMFDHYFLTLPQGQRMLFLVWGLSLSMLEWRNEV